MRVGRGLVRVVQLAALRMFDAPRRSPLTTHEPAIFTAVLVSGAVVVFLGVLLEAANPARTLSRIALVTLALSLVPDLAIGFSSVTWASWPLAVTLMVMHVVAWGDGGDAHRVCGVVFAGGGAMTNEKFAFGRDQRHEILKAVRAIERQLESMSTRPQWQALYVISTNLAIIQAAVTGMPRVSSN